MEHVTAETDPEIEHWLHGDEPNWDLIDFDVLCSRCDYNLRLLPEPRCPECGLRFEWRALLEARLHGSESLFENRWRDRPIRSWLLTAWRGLRPRRFWQGVSIHDHVRARPLLVFLLSAIPAFLVTVHAVAGILWLIFWSLRQIPIGPTMYVGPWRRPLLKMLAEDAMQLATLPVSFESDYLYLPLGAFLVLGSATILLTSLRQTLGRCRVRPVQVLRVAAYAAVPAAIAMGTAAVTMNVASLCLWLFNPHSFVYSALDVLAMISPALILGVYLSVGLHRYLHLPRPWLLGLTASAVATLFMETVFAFTTVLRMGGW